MPNRIVREAILTSERVDELDPSAEVFYRRLLSKVDDYGRYDARPSVLRASLFPLRLDRVREADCTRWMAACQKAGLIVLYTHDGKPYLEVVNTGWAARSPSKFPALQTSANICAQMQTNARLDVDVVVVEDVVVDTPASDDAAPPVTKKPKGQSCTLPTFLTACREAGEDAIPADDPIHAYAERVGLPSDYVRLAWRWFKSKYGPDGSGRAKRYTDWRRHFRNSVEGGWPKYWAIDQSGGYYLTTAGKQAEREAQT